MIKGGTTYYHNSTPVELEQLSNEALLCHTVRYHRFENFDDAGIFLEKDPMGRVVQVRRVPCERGCGIIRTTPVRADGVPTGPHSYGYPATGWRVIGNPDQRDYIREQTRRRRGGQRYLKVVNGQ